MDAAWELFVGIYGAWKGFRPSSRLATPEAIAQQVGATTADPR